MTKTKYDTTEYLKSVDAYWRAATYLSVGQLFLMDNPLLRRELKATDVTNTNWPLGNDRAAKLYLRALEPGNPKV